MLIIMYNTTYYRLTSNKAEEMFIILYILQDITSRRAIEAEEILIILYIVQQSTSRREIWPRK